MVHLRKKDKKDKKRRTRRMKRKKRKKRKLENQLERRGGRNEVLF